MIKSSSKIRIPVDDNKKLSLKDYRGLIYKFIKQFQNSSEEGDDMDNKEKINSLKNSLGPSKNLIQTKKACNSS